MLIAIFALLLISVVAIALIVTSGTDTTLAGNYRTSTSAYYAGLAGLEEVRGRLSLRDPAYINKAAANFLPAPVPPPNNSTMAVTQLLYVLNPGSGETVAPWDLSNAATYPDLEYQREFPTNVISSALNVPSSAGSAGIAGPLYKWVRITPATEYSLKIDVDQNGVQDQTTPIFYDPAHISLGTGKAGLIVSNSPPATARQVFQISALAVLPNNTQKLVQYVVVQNSLNFQAALTLVGNGVSYTGPDSATFNVDGNEPTAGRTCLTPALPPVYALGYTNSGDNSTVVAGTVPHSVLYKGFPPPLPPATPSVWQVTYPNLQTVNDWEFLLKDLRKSADVIVKPGDPWPPSLAMTPATPWTIFADRDLDLTGWHGTGYGLLVVTGTLTYDPDASWEGVVLVVGKGIFTASHLGSGRIDGAVLVAQTRDSGGNVLAGPSLGPTSVTYDPTTGGTGIYFDSCWINAALAPLDYKILSFREIPYP